MQKSTDFPKEQGFDWSVVKGEIQRNWGGLGSDELDKRRRDPGALAEFIAKQSGMNPQETSRKLNDIIANAAPSEQGAPEGIHHSGRDFQGPSEDTGVDPNREQKAHDAVAGQPDVKPGQGTVGQGPITTNPEGMA